MQRRSHAVAGRAGYLLSCCHIYMTWRLIIHRQMGQLVTIRFIEGTDRNVEVFSPADNLGSRFGVPRSEEVGREVWTKKHPLLWPDIMPPNGSWVRIKLENGMLSCAAQVYKRDNSGKKATLLFWDKQLDSVANSKITRINDVWLTPDNEALQN